MKRIDFQLLLVVLDSPLDGAATPGQIAEADMAVNEIGFVLDHFEVNLLRLLVFFKQESER